MKRFLDGKMRMLSLLLSLVLAVGLIQVNAVTASAAGNTYNYAYDCQRSPVWPGRGDTFTASRIQKPYDAATQPTEPDGTWVLTSKGYWSSSSKTTLGATEYFDSVIRNVATAYGIQPTQVEVYQLTKNGIHIAYGAVFARSDYANAITTFLGDNWDDLGCTYLLCDSAVTLNSSVNVTIKEDVSTSAPAVHTHTWPVVTPDGNGTKEASATITCTDPNCDETVTVALKASDVTLPGDVFTAEISTTPGTSNNALRATPALPEGLRMSSEPGYKYSVSGSDFTSIDPNNFTPKQGIYQASIVVMSGNAEVANLAVKYTVSDPVVTAATGDNRPIEIMVMGLVVFSAMAAVAFIFDSKRRVGR